MKGFYQNRLKLQDGNARNEYGFYYTTKSAKINSLKFNLERMLDLAFWYYLLGVLFLAKGILLLFTPKEAKRLLKGITKRVSTMRMMGFGILPVIVLMWYSAAFQEGVTANILLVLSYIALAKSLFLLYAPRWSRRKIIKTVLKWNDTYFQIGGVIIVSLGIVCTLYGALYI